MCLRPCQYWRLSCPLFPSYKDSVPVIHGAHLSTCPLSTCISLFMKDPCRFFAFLWGFFVLLICTTLFLVGVFPQACNPWVSASQVFLITGKSHHTQLLTVSFIIKGFQYFYTTNSANISYYGVNSLCFAKEPLLLFNIIKLISCIGPCNFLLIVLL